MKKILSLLLVALMLVGMLPMMPINASTAETTVTLSFANKAQRTTYSTTQQVWQQNGITLTNDKDKSSSNVGDYANPVRLYAKSKVTIAYPGMTKIVFNCNSSKGTSGLTGGLAAAGIAYTTGTGYVVTATFAEPTDSISFSATAQFQLNSIAVTADVPECEHSCTEEVTTAPTCTASGVKTYTCTLCKVYKYTESIPATGHSFDGRTCTTCQYTAPDVAGEYYIAATRATEDTAANYFYMTSDLGTAGTQRYTAVDSGRTEMPDSLNVEGVTVFTLVENADLTFSIYANDVENEAKYVGWTSGNSGTLVTVDSALKLTANETENGLYTFQFTEESGNVRFLSLNSDAASNWFAFYTGTQIQNLALVSVSDCDHAYEESVTKEATCTEAGVKTFTCSKCGDSYMEEIAKLDHNFDENNVCTVCGFEFESEPDTPDQTASATITFDDKAKRTAYSTSQQVWEENGITVTNTGSCADYAAPVRFYKNTKVVIAYNSKITKIEVNCNTASYATSLQKSIGSAATVSDKVVTIVLTESAESYTIEKLSDAQVRVDSITVYAEAGAHVHSWSEWVQTKDPTCTTVGTKTASCDCGETKTQNVDALGHSYDADGNCTVCKITPAEVLELAYALESSKALEGTYTLTGVIISVDEAYSDQYKNVTVTMVVGDMTDKPIQCYHMKGTGTDVIGVGDIITVTGSIKKYYETVEFDQGCTLDTYTDTCADGHKEETVAGYAATCTTAGLTDGKKCSVCNEVTVAQEEVPALGHDYVNGTCSVCGTPDPNAPTEPVMPEVGQLKFSAISLVLQASLTANYKVDGKYFADGAYTNPYVTFDFAGKETIVVTDYYIQNDGTYVFPLTGISPQLMNENIVAVIYAEYNGTTFNSNEQNYSIAKYCYSQLGKSTNAKFRTMLVDLLNYGAAAQIKAPWKADELVNAALTAEQQAEASKHELVFEDHQNTKYNVIDAPTVSWKAISLVLDSTVATKITFAASDISNLTVRFTLADGTVLADYTKDDMVAAASAGQYYVIFDKMNANQMHVPFYVTVYEGDTVVSNTLQYSVVTYVGKQQAKAEEKLLNLMNAMLRYGDSAKAYGG